jgi:DUF2934 family protein
MSKQVLDQVEQPAAHAGIKTARNLPDAANSEQSIEGYAAVNGLDERTEIARLAYKLFEERGSQEGDADGDWFRAEEEIRRRRHQERV